MNLFNFFRKKENTDEPKLTKDSILKSFSVLSESNNIDIQKFVDFDLRKPEKTYDDSYATDEGYKLRELLLLVWIGRVKNGRDRIKPIPKYFLYDYDLNEQNTINTFKKMGLVSIDEDETMRLTKKGENLSRKYNSLWSMHSFKNGTVNIDLHFGGWNEISYTIAQNNIRIKYISQRKQYFEAVLSVCSKTHEDLPDYPKNEIKIIDKELQELTKINNNLK
ncbi:hypothetical protein [Leuconostoc citreum]|uniref:hypothetical protein n=1 Tax=Leuconostoc citreum TaxID=33964 RepID=UPI0032DE533A